MKHICLFFLLLTVFLNCSSPEPVEVRIPDANLAAAVREALRLDPSESIWQRKLARLKTLKVQRRNIKNLTGLEEATGLITLDLSQNQIEDITPLAGLTGLKSLYLRHNQISDITPLTGLKTAEAFMA